MAARARIVTALFMLALAIGSSSPSGRADTKQVPPLDIDAAIEGEEREAIIRIMLQILTPEERKNVHIIYVTNDGRVLTNKVHLKRQFRFLDRVGDNIYQDARGEVYIIPEPEHALQPEGSRIFSPRCRGNDGPYRRVHTKPGFGLVKAFRVHLPGAESIRVIPGSETPFIMLGGWGKNGRGAVEGGLHYSPTFNDWALFLLVQGREPIPDVEGFRFAANQNVELTFGGASVNQAFVQAQGRHRDGGGINRMLKVTDLPPGWGWSFTGEGMVLRRTTSIAQDKQDFETGSFFRNVDWIETQLQSGTESLHTWRADETGGTCNWPDATRVQVIVRRPDSEVVNIVLGTGRPRPRPTRTPAPTPTPGPPTPTPAPTPGPTPTTAPPTPTPTPTGLPI